MVTKEVALRIQERALKAIIELSTILEEIANSCPEEDFAAIKRGVGLSIGKIQMELLEIINAQHPEIDDLRD